MHRGKLKVKGGVKKRLKRTGSGKIKRKRAFHGHKLTKKNAKRKHRLGSSTLVSSADMTKITRALGGY